MHCTDQGYQPEKDNLHTEANIKDPDLNPQTTNPNIIKFEIKNCI